MTTVATTTATSTAGTFLESSGRPKSMASVPRPRRSVVVFVWSRSVKKALTSSMKESASVEKPKSLGSWPTMIVMASPFM